MRCARNSPGTPLVNIDGNLVGLVEIPRRAPRPRLVAIHARQAGAKPLELPASRHIAVGGNPAQRVVQFSNYPAVYDR